jgi:hypothetical protein
VSRITGHPLLPRSCLTSQCTQQGQPLALESRIRDVSIQKNIFDSEANRDLGSGLAIRVFAPGLKNYSTSEDTLCCDCRKISCSLQSNLTLFMNRLTCPFFQ